MTEHDIDPRLGAPTPDVTHWGISRLTDFARRLPSGRKKPNTDKLSYPCDDGVRISSWPIDELSLDVIRERWGAGSYRIHWLCRDPEHPGDLQRQVPRGSGPVFTLEPIEVEAEEEPEPLPPPPAPQALPVGGDAAAMLQFAQAMMSMSDNRTNQMIDAMLRTTGRAPAAVEAGADYRAEVAALRAEMIANEKRREEEARHRDELAKKDAEIAEMKRKLEDAEREEASGPIFEPGTPFTEQLPSVLGNVLTAIALKSPETAIQLMGAAKDFFVPKPATTPPPPQPSAFTQQPPVPVVPRQRLYPSPQAAVAPPVVHGPAAPPPPPVPTIYGPAPFPGSTTPTPVHVVPANGARRAPAESPPSSPLVPEVMP